MGTMPRPLWSPWTHVCLYILLGTPQAQCEELDMRLGAFDDQYKGCEEEMDRLAPGLLEKEMYNSSPFRIAWENSSSHWQTVKTDLKLPQGFTDEHGRAIIVSTNGAFHPIFAKEQRKAWTSRDEYVANFPFKAFHYYLTRALRLLRGNCDVMYNTTVYRGTKHSYTKEPPTGSGNMRFGNFTSSSTDEAEAKKFGTETVFTIHTCFGVNIMNYSYNKTQKEVLIPVHEKFNVVKGQDSHSFVLWSTNQTCSCFNCAFLNAEKTNSVCACSSATRGGIAFPSQMSPSLFGGSIILIHVAALKLFASF